MFDKMMYPFIYRQKNNHEVTRGGAYVLNKCYSICHCDQDAFKGKGFKYENGGAIHNEEAMAVGQGLMNLGICAAMNPEWARGYGGNDPTGKAFFRGTKGRFDPDIGYPTKPYSCAMWHNGECRASIFTHCAAENAKCKCSGTVRYGAENTWVEKHGVQGTIHCHNSAFGDPFEGVAKTCQCRQE